jgi:hypothetical protein
MKIIILDPRSSDPTWGDAEGAITVDVPDDVEDLHDWVMDRKWENPQPVVLKDFNHLSDEQKRDVKTLACAKLMKNKKVLVWESASSRFDDMTAVEILNLCTDLEWIEGLNFNINTGEDWGDPCAETKLDMPVPIEESGWLVETDAFTREYTLEMLSGLDFVGNSHDLTDGSVKRIIEDCARFQQENKIAIGGRDGIAGRSFGLSRKALATYHWGHIYSATARDTLERAAKEFGRAEVILKDTGRLCYSVVPAIAPVKETGQAGDLEVD